MQGSDKGGPWAPHHSCLSRKPKSPPLVTLPALEKKGPTVELKRSLRESYSRSPDPVWGMMSPSPEHLGGGREGLVMRPTFRVDVLPARRAQEWPLLVLVFSFQKFQERIAKISLT